MKMRNLILTAVVGSSLVACQGSHESKDLSYSLTQNGCATGTVKYSSATDLCAALKDDARNKHCALSMRYEKFRAECPGQSWSN